MYTREKCREVLTSNKSDDQKLYEVFQMCKDDIRCTNLDLYYALLGWADVHKRELDPVASASAMAGYFK